MQNGWARTPKVKAVVEGVKGAEEESKKGHELRGRS